MKPTRKRGMKPKPKGGIKPLHIFFLIFGTCGLILFAEVSKPVYPSPPTSGEGLTPVAVGNASPEPITVLITNASGKVYQVNIPSCSTCKTLVPATPEQNKCSADTVYKNFALSPGTHQLKVLSSNVFNKKKVHRTEFVVTKESNAAKCFFNIVGDDGQPW